VTGGKLLMQRLMTQKSRTSVGGLFRCRRRPVRDQLNPVEAGRDTLKLSTVVYRFE